MSSDTINEILSSRNRLKIAALISRRPRSLGELADLTGISIQGVLKHLDRLKELGIDEDVKLKEKGISVHKVYAVRGAKIGDFSVGDLAVAKFTRAETPSVKSKDPLLDLESLAEDVILQRRRIRDQARRLGRMIDQLADDESRVDGVLNGMSLTVEDRLVLRALFTEESVEEGRRVLSKYYGVKDGGRSIEKQAAGAKQVAKK